MDKRRIKTIEIRLKSHAEKPKKQVAARVIPSHKGKLLCIVALAVACSACSSAGLHFQGEDYAQISGSAAGIRELMKGMNGFVTTGKSAPNTIDSYWQNQDRETDVKRLKFPQPIKIGGK